MKILFFLLVFCSSLSAQWNLNVYDVGTLSNDTVYLQSVSFENYLANATRIPCHVYGYGASDSEEFVYATYYTAGNIFVVDSIITNYYGTHDAVNFPSDTGVAYVTVQYWYNYLSLLYPSGGGGGSGTVTSVAAVAHQGLSVSGTPITTSGTLTFGITNGSLGDSLMATTYLKASNNLSDVVSQSSARTNLGLGTSATHASTDYFLVANNLSEGVAATIKTNLSLNNVENTALSTWAGTSNITTLGTIATGVWSGTAIVYSKLALTGAILNADLAGSIAYSKLSLTGAILNADLAGSIALTKLANLSGTSLLIGSSASSAAAQEITLGTNLSMSGTTLNAASGSLSGLTNNGAAYATGATSITSTAGMTSGQLLIGGTGTPALATLTGTVSQIIVTNGNNSITLSTPQGIGTANAPQFARMGLGIAADATIPLWIERAGNGTTSSNGIMLDNNTAATSLATVQYSPRMSFIGAAWNSTGSNSESDRFAIETQPQTVAGTTTALFVTKVSIAGGSFSNVMTVSDASVVTATMFSGALSGNATTATNVAASGITGATLASGVTASSLTSFGASPSFTTPILGTPTSGNLVNCTGYVGTSALITLGTVTTGTWSATAIAETKGGTNQTTYTTGDILYASGSNALSKLAIGGATTILTGGTTPSWATNNGGWTVVKVTGSDFTTTGQTLVDITGLSFAATNSTNYWIDAWLDCTTSAVITGVEFGVNTTGAGGSALPIILYLGPTTSGSGITSSTNANNTASSAFLTTSSEEGFIHITGVVKSGTSSPTISIRGLKVTSGTLTVKVGSYLAYRVQ